MTTTTFDTIVIGAGQAGPFLAVKLSEQGKTVALIEKRQIGGTCINRGCTPTKTLRKSARVAHLMSRASSFGVEVGEQRINFPDVMERMKERVTRSRGGLESWLGGMQNLTIHNGHAELVGKRGDVFEVKVGEQILSAPRIVLNTGTRPFVPPISGLENTPFLTNEELLELKEAPKKLLVVGGSYIGLEMGQIFHRIGSDVTIIEGGPRLTSREDHDISEAIEEMLRTEGLDIRTDTKVESVASSDDGITLTLSNGETLSGSHLLVATGRIPNTDGLGLESVDVATDKRGYIKTNGHLETETAGIFALGDINRRGAFTHTSYQDHEILADHWAGGTRTADNRVMAYSMFTDPPLGHVGMYEREAIDLAKNGRNISQAVFAMSNVSRAKEESEETGLIKILIDEDTGHFLGASILGINADEIIQSINLVMACGGTWQAVRDALPVHPTVTEFFPTILDRRKPLE